MGTVPTTDGTAALAAKAIAAVIVLPGTMGFVLPLLVFKPRDAAIADPIGVGVVAVVAGTLLLFWCVREFLVAGEGTLAPWWPPKRLVTTGPFALSRNPIYVAMALVALGWAVAYRSPAMLIYAGVLILAFHVRILLGEEPAMARLFGAQWTDYARRVSRWIGIVKPRVQDSK